MERVCNYASSEGDPAPSVTMVLLYGWMFYSSYLSLNFINFNDVLQGHNEPSFAYALGKFGLPSIGISSLASE